MKYYKLLIILLIAGLIFGCSQAQKSDLPATGQKLSDEDQIRQLFKEYIERIKEGDKTVLYENELKYYTDSVSLSMYMEIPKVLDYKYDSLNDMTVDTIRFMDDSALALVTVQYLSADGSFKDHKYPLKVYKRKYDDKWVRPYQSSYAIEAEFNKRYEEYLKAIGEGEGE